MNKFVAIVCMILFLGCTTKKKFVDKTIEHTEITKISEASSKVERAERKDTIQKKEETKQSVTKDVDLSVVFDPKKNDSLRVTHIDNGDSLMLDIKGNGVVNFNFKKKKKTEDKKENKIFNSETLFNIDSTAKEIQKSEIDTNKVSKTKEKKENETTFSIYMVLFGLGVLAMVLFFIHKKTNIFKNKK